MPKHTYVIEECIVILPSMVNQKDNNAAYDCSQYSDLLKGSNATRNSIRENASRCYLPLAFNMAMKVCTIPNGKIANLPVNKLTWAVLISKYVDLKINNNQGLNEYDLKY